MRLKPFCHLIRSRLVLVCLLFLAISVSAAPRLEIRLNADLATNALSGRLFLIFAQEEHDEPRLTMEDTAPQGPIIFARDVTNFTTSKGVVLNDSWISNRPLKLSVLPARHYHMQALLDLTTDIRDRNGPGNLYSQVSELDYTPEKKQRLTVELTQRIPEPDLSETGFVRYVQIQSRLLSEFHKRPIYLRAGVILPRTYDSEPDRRYPLWIDVGGYGQRYHHVGRMMQGDFAKFWQSNSTPQMIYVLPDGAGPYGDPYQVNSANNGPYGHAFVRELLPAIEKQFRGAGRPQGRVLSGHSTGAWVALALQIFYPGEFAGAWASSPDPVDFRAFQLLNIYAEANAYINPHGEERPSARDEFGDTRLSMRREVQLESVFGRDGQWTRSGEQWGAWNAVFSPRGADGLPMPLWDAAGRLNPTVAKHWKKYDLRFVLEDNWAELAPRLRGKLHISVGEMDDYFLNGAVHQLEIELAKREPKDLIRFTYGPGGHGWKSQKLGEELAEMYQATQTDP